MTELVVGGLLAAYAILAIVFRPLWPIFAAASIIVAAAWWTA